LCDREGKEVARGLVNYNSSEIKSIVGQHSEKIAAILGYEGADTVVHRNNLVITN
jgi:glutamate 5-kinase